MKTILLIDDDAKLREMYRTALVHSGYRVLEADSGVTGLAMARKYLPDLILTDVHMPGGDGSTLLRDIRHDPELRSRQVVLMTGQPDLITPRKGMEEGADDFLVKPVSLNALKKCMEARFSRAAISWRVEDHLLAQLRASLPPQLPHEFFTPLAGIIGLMEILRDEFYQLGPAEMQEIHRDVYESALRLHRTQRNYLLILDLTDGSAPSKPPAPLAAADVEKRIRTGVEGSLRLHDRQGDTNIRLEAQPLLVSGENLTHIVEELTDNAYKFSRKGTPVTVEMIGGKLTVTDQGRGLTDEEIARIGAFKQFDRKKHEQQGLGLGLVLVQKLAALCGAKFLVESRHGEGTRVEIDFPLANPSGG